MGGIIKQVSQLSEKEIPSVRGPGEAEKSSLSVRKVTI